MPKRLIALILVCCCVFHQAVYAEEITLRLYRLEETAAYRRAHPYIHFQSVEYPAWSDPTALLDTGAADVVYLDGQRSDMRSVLARPHLLQDLSGSMMITDTIARMVPWVQDYVTSADGSVYAVPLNASIRCFSCRHEGWTAAGFSDKDIPQSYEELLAFLDAWCDRLEENPDQPARVADLTIWNTGNEKYNYCWWLMEMLVSSYVMQCHYAGQEVRFDDPVFIELAQHTLETGSRLTRLEPNGTRTAALPELFHNGLRGGRVANDGHSYEFSCAVPMRLTCDQPPLIMAGIELAVIPSASPQTAEAVRFLEDRVQSIPWRNAAVLLTDFTAGDYRDPDSNITLHIDEGWLRDYHSFNGIFYCCPNVFGLSRERSTGKEDLMMKFFKHEISAQTFAQRLDQLIH